MKWYQPTESRVLGWRARAILHVIVVLMVFVTAEFESGASPVPIDPGTIEGEAGIAGCPDAALLAVAHVNANHVARYGQAPAWYGWARPSAAAFHYARYWGEYADPTGGAIHLFSFQDAHNPRVQALTRKLTLTFEIACPGGTGLRGYR